MNETYKIAFLTIAFNFPEFIGHQARCIKRFCKDKEYDILVIDNSNIETQRENIQQQCESLGVKYFKVESDIIKPKRMAASDDHAFALKYAFNKFKDEYDYIFFLDHDIFPIKDFSVVELLKLNTENKLIAAGLPQGSNKTFFWAGCFLLNMRDVDLSLIGNFSPIAGLGLDTNGDTHKLLEVYEKDRFCFFNEEFITNNHFLHIISNKQDEVRQNGGGEVNDPYKEYQLIANATFLHFRGGSNYVSCVLYAERMGSLFNVLNEKINK